MAANGFYAKPKVSYAADNGFCEMRFKPPSHANNTPPRSITALKELSPAPCNLSLPSPATRFPKGFKKQEFPWNVRLFAQTLRFDTTRRIPA